MRVRDVICTAVDFETTGSVRGYRDEPWQIGLVDVRGGAFAADTQFTSLLNVGDRPFNPHAPGRHGQRREEIAAAPPLASLWPVLRERLVGRALVAHNAATERKMLRGCFPMHRFGPWIDTLALSRYAFPHLASHALADVVDHLGLADRANSACPGLTWHDALYDAVASALVLETILDLPTWQNVSTESLSSV